jgi:truncated hemoglobin YjbI
VSHYDDLGGEPVLRAIIHEFVERITSDLMIGFFFAGVDKTRLERLEFEHAAEHLGGPFTYSGRSMTATHKRHAIMGGQFGRRREILRQTLVKHNVPGAVQAAWLAHVDSLRGEVTHDASGECNAAGTGPVAAHGTREDSR